MIPWHVTKGYRSRSKRENKRTVNLGAGIRTTGTLMRDCRTIRGNSINISRLESLVSNSDLSSGLDIAGEECELRKLPGSSTVSTPNTANESSNSSSTNESEKSDSEERSCHDKDSETNNNSPNPQAHDAEDVQGYENKRKRSIVEDKDCNSARKKQASQCSDISGSAAEAGGCQTTLDENVTLESPLAAEVELSRKEWLQLKRFDMVSKLLEEKILGKEGQLITLSDIKECREMIQVMGAKYRKSQESNKWKPGPKACKHPMTKEEFTERLQGSEEKQHPWAGNADDPDPPVLLMRAWDEMSQCQIRDPLTGFLAGSPSAMLNTPKERQLALQQHSDWGNRVKTPFISTTNSVKEIFNTRIPWFQERQERKCIQDNTRLSLINPRARLAAGRPLLRMKKELIHYHVRTKYGKVSAYKDLFYENEFLLPYSCGPDEIVGTWTCREIDAWTEENKSDYDGWHKQVGMVALEEHERSRLSGES